MMNGIGLRLNNIEILKSAKYNNRLILNKLKDLSKSRNFKMFPFSPLVLCNSSPSPKPFSF